MSLAASTLLIGIAACAAYIQTLTGFAFGLIMMAGVALTGTMTLPDAAVLVGILTLINAGQMLTRGWRDVAWKPLMLIMLGSLPMLAAGYVLLSLLAHNAAEWLRLLLGVVVMLSCVQMVLSTSTRSTVSSGWSMALYGGVSGLMGGLFSTSGPPLVYHLYRQPLPVATIRETLVAVFAINAVLRLAMVVGANHLPTTSQWSGLLAIPAVMLATLAARKYPLPLSPTVFRWLVLVLLFLSGVSLVLPAALNLLGSCCYD